MIERCMVLSETSTQEEINVLYEKEVGTIFKVKGDYEAVLSRIEQGVPQGKKFEVFPINPGTQLFSQWGPDHCVITENKAV